MVIGKPASGSTEDTKIATNGSPQVSEPEDEVSITSPTPITPEPEPAAAGDHQNSLHEDEGGGGGGGGRWGAVVRHKKFEELRVRLHPVLAFYVLLLILLSDSLPDTHSRVSTQQDIALTIGKNTT